MARANAPDYKGLSFPQLRSFCEVARRGSMKAAATSMRVAQPTVWKQIHALEKTLKAKLVESDRRGTQLTQSGRLLLQLCGPAVNELDVIEQRFAEELEQVERRFVVAATPRVCFDELPECLPRFKEAYPNVRLVFREVRVDNVVPLVEVGEADVGLADIRWSVVQEELAHQLCYEIEPTLVVSAKHQLATKKKIRLSDLAKHPLLNAKDSFPNAEINAALNGVGAYDHPDRSVELLFAHTIVRYVQLGYGIGLIGRARGHKRAPSRGTRERSLADILPTLPVQAVFRKSLSEDPVLVAFVNTLRDQFPNGR